jgi:hypothetical protein
MSASLPTDMRTPVFQRLCSRMEVPCGYDSEHAHGHGQFGRKARFELDGEHIDLKAQVVDYGMDDVRANQVARLFLRHGFCRALFCLKVVRSAGSSYQTTLKDQNSCWRKSASLMDVRCHVRWRL